MLTMKPRVHKMASDIGTKLVVVGRSCSVCGCDFWSNPKYRNLISNWIADKKPLPWMVRCPRCGNVVSVAG